MVSIERLILLIDDDERSCAKMAAYLRERGYRIHTVDGGKEGVLWCQDHSPDLVISELRLPAFSGLDVLKTMRDNTPETPVILISDMGMVNEVAEALRHGAADYLVKPIVDMSVLAHSVKRALEMRDLHDENLRYKTELEEVNRELKDYVRVLERDQEAAKQTQRNLLPITPVEYNHVQVSHRLIPSLYLSGDFLDYGFLSKRYIAFYLTDVSGHGASSAFVTVWLKQLVRRLFRERRVFRTPESLASDPANLLEIINHDVMQSRFFCHLTCFIGVIDTHTNEMYYVLAGHLPLPILVSQGVATYLTGKGKPVGIFSDATWTVHHVQLPEDYALTVFSDGILEILPTDDLLQKEAVLLEKMSNTEGQLTAIAEQFGLDCLDNAPDDIAVLTIRNGAVAKDS